MKYSVALLSAFLTALVLTAYGAAPPILPDDASQNYFVTVDQTGFAPGTLNNAESGDQITFNIIGDTDHEISQQIPGQCCVGFAGGNADSGLRPAGTNTTWVYSVPDPFAYPWVAFCDWAVYDNTGTCRDINIVGN